MNIEMLRKNKFWVILVLLIIGPFGFLLLFSEDLRKEKYITYTLGAWLILWLLSFSNLVSVGSLTFFSFMDNLIFLHLPLPFTGVWSIFGLMVGCLYGVITAWKKYNLESKIVIIPVVVFTILLALLFLINKPFDALAEVKNFYHTNNSESLDESRESTTAVPADAEDMSIHSLHDETPNLSSSISINSSKDEWISCSSCDGKGTVYINQDCGQCKGKGSTSCQKCAGIGRQDCSACHANGFISCQNCNGNGRRTCQGCNGNPQRNCNSCNGRGNTNCNSCMGRGFQSYANGNSVCNSCVGAGIKQCSSCSGAGINVCQSCKGAASTQCSTCLGSGRKSCQSCSGVGGQSCSYCNGKGFENCTVCSNSGGLSVSQSCSKCNGEGKILSEL